MDAPDTRASVEARAVADAQASVDTSTVADTRASADTRTSPGTGDAVATGVGGAGDGSAGRLAARVLTEVFAPAVLAAAMPIAVALHAAATPAAGLGWGLLADLFCAVIPYGVIRLGVHRGQLTDHHIRVREQRTRPLGLGLTSVLIGLALLVLLGAPRQLTGLVVAMLAGLLVLTTITLFWKISAHAGVSAGSVTVLVIVFGPVLLVTTLVVAAVGWSRVRLRDHTTAQVIAGTAVGAVVAAATYLPFS